MNLKELRKEIKELQESESVTDLCELRGIKQTVETIEWELNQSLEFTHPFLLSKQKEWNKIKRLLNIK